MILIMQSCHQKLGLFSLVLSPFILFGVFSLFLNELLDSDSISSSIIDIEIPWPSGIVTEAITVANGDIYRIGRVLYNSVSLRETWGRVSIIENVLTEIESLDIINRTDTFVDLYGWPVGRHIDYGQRPTQDLSMENIYPVKKERNKILRKIKSKIFLKIANDCGLNISKLQISDLFLTKYDSNIQNRNGLGVHRDKSQWSFVIPLNDYFEGGGTYFVETEMLYKPPKKSALLFSGTKYHGGTARCSFMFLSSSSLIDISL